MKNVTWFQLIMVSLVALGVTYSAYGAELKGKDFPYWIFNDKGLTTYCFEPEYVGQETTRCWANGGIERSCKILTEAEGYIDCPEF